MKRIFRSIVFFAIGIFCLILSGCQLLTLPLVGLYYLFGTATHLVFSLIPVAVRLLPLLLIFVEVPADTPETAQYAFVSNNIPQLYKQYSLDNESNIPDGLTFLQDNFVKYYHSADTIPLMLVFDYGTPAEEINRIVTKQLHGRAPLRVSTHIVNGISLYNDKFIFFSLLEKLSLNGIEVKSFGSLQSATTLFNQSCKRYEHI